MADPPQEISGDHVTRDALRRRSFVAVLVLAGSLGGWLRFSGLGNRDFWFDESCTFIYVHNLFDWPEDSNLLAESTNLPYYVLLRGWSSIFGESEAAYRSMSAVAAVLTVLVLSLLACQVGGPIAGIVCAIIAALHPLHIHYAHEARAYALWLLNVTVVLAALVEASRRRGWFWWGIFGVALLACLHLHYFTLYLVPCSVAAILLADNRPRALRRWLVTVAVGGVAFSPYFVLAVWPAAQGGGGAWVAHHWDPVTAIPRSLWAFLPAGAYPAHLRGLSLLSPDTVRFENTWLVTANGVARALPAVLLLGAVVSVVRSRRSLNDQTRTASKSSASHVFLAATALGPLVLAWLYSVLVRPNYLVGRYDMIAWPASVVWMSFTLAQMIRCSQSRRGLRLGWAMPVALAACSVMPIARMLQLRPPPTFPNVRAQRLAEITAPTDLVIALSYDRDYLLYYLHRAGFAARIVSFPSWLDRQIGWVDTAADTDPAQAAAVVRDARGRIELITETITRGGRVWLLEDSLDRQRNGPRAPIHEQLLEAVKSAGYQAYPVDERLLIMEIRKRVPR